MEKGTVRRSDLGTPQGGVISPLLANIYLNYFDILWERHGSGIGELMVCEEEATLTLDRIDPRGQVPG
ncbi:hypothetical protein PGRAT_28635 [Paenibacillus graminis]|uniref:Reverse transcriptase domain-containing protein n=1 Tax=Paenibacillus graminis TaxID=189425 RepID=A0A089NPU3_9BACL|nr:hypothetical protein PGRAT_28635 [Paenibacillus graminis]